MNIRQVIRKNIANIPGWCTSRKIIVIESDDWGSIRTQSKKAYDRMLKAGLAVNANHYNATDALESDEDMENLFSVLSEFKDSTNRAPAFTAMCIMGNPDFEKIAASDFQIYYFQPLAETLADYPNHNKVLHLWRQGREARLFVPALHGREHLNVRRYMRLLQSGDEGMRVAFAQRSVGVGSYKGRPYPNYLGALHPKSLKEVLELHEQLKQAGTLFEEYVGHPPTCFMAPNAEEPKELESTLKKIGVRYLTRAKKRVYPVGDGTFRTEWNYIGRQNELGQTILTRNCFFEPVCWGEHEHISDWVDNCLKEIAIAFRWRKPAIISSHRVNYIGHIRPENREKGLSALRKLLKTILQKWQEVEFMTTEELGDLIAKDK